ncbi:MAG: cytochrome d ubiquinol oxidase subunit II, partial [Calditrichaeota bacterium]|nr:cytochrome d ubiquinol oxidase subunit II [Calditrichota bacterium]
METIWFIIWGLLWGVYFMLDGFDFGAGTLMPFIAKSEIDRKKIFNAIGPFWDGNEVWLITAGGVTFAAFPGAYATMFSAMYSAFMLILFALIIRGSGMVLREELAENQSARNFWDWMFTIGSFVAALLWGVAFANLFKGIPIDAEGVYHGSILTLLNPYGLLGGLLFLTFFMMHGSIWLSLKTDGDLHDKTTVLAGKFWGVLVILSVVFLIATVFATDLYANYLNNPVLFILPLLVVLGLIFSGLFIKARDWSKAWFASSVYIFFATMFGVVGMYP